MFTDQATTALLDSPSPDVFCPPQKPRKRSDRPLVGQSKACTKCGVVQDLSEFAIKRGSRASRCRSCQKEISDAYYRDNAAKVLATSRDRNEEVREALRLTRDSYLAECICEDCSSTVDLQITTRPGYEGESVHEVVAGAFGPTRMEAALANSLVLCRPCMNSKYGQLGALGKARRKMASTAPQAT